MRNALIEAKYDEDGYVDCHIEGSVADVIKLTTAIIDSAADATGTHAMNIIGEVLRALPHIQTHKAEGLTIDISALDDFYN